MKHWTKLDIEDLEYTTSRNTRKIEFLDIESAFDIETTSMVVEGRKTAFMYIWMFGIGHGREVYYGRTWDELRTFVGILVEKLELSADRRLVVYSHGLSYEFQFMRNEFEWASSFNLDERKPLRATTVDGIEFRDSYILSGFSLENTANNLTEHKVEKLVGSLDYEKIRHHNTPLTEDEMAYCRGDIVVLTAYINEQLEIYGSIVKMPLTNTARVRKFVRDRVYFTDKDHKKSSASKYRNYRKLMNKLTLTVKEYYLLKKAFQGGFVHANPIWAGETMENVTGIDLSSSYPAAMLSEQYPMGPGVEVEPKSKEEFEALLKDYCVVFRIQFKGLRSKIRHENYISESKCDILEGKVVNNGRVKSADLLETTITDVDYRIIKQAYEWDGFQVKDVIRYPRGYLPKDFIEAILDLYKDKTELKDVEGKEAEYTHSKGMLNSTFGMTVTDIVRADIRYENGWNSELPVVKEEIKAYNTSKGRFLYYPWGVWITAYARRNLWGAILHFGNDYLYSDTDGIKLTNYALYEDFVNGYNTLVKRKLELMCANYRIDPERLSPKSKDGTAHLLGVWEHDGFYEKFKTLGAKRYSVQKGDDVELTVAGVGKRSARDYMLKECAGDIDKVFKMFNNELTIPKDYSGNLTHTYIDESMEFEVKDYFGNNAIVHTKSGIHLESVDFSLSLTSTYIAFIDMLKEGYVFKGADRFNG